MKLKCIKCGMEVDFPFEINTHRHKEYELDNVSPNYWLPIYDYNKIKFNLNSKKKGVFKYLSLMDMPIKKQLSFGEGETSIYEYKKGVYIKDESSNPFGSFKSRGMPFLMNEALYHNKSEVAIVSTGNAAISMINYAKLYGLKSTIFVPQDIDEKRKCLLKQANKLFFCKDIICAFEEFFNYCHKNPNVFNGYLTSNYSYLQGISTITYEIYNTLKKFPDYLILPCASGGNVVAQTIAIQNLKKLKLIKNNPQIICVQIQEGDPIKQGIEKGEKNLFVIDNPIDSETILSCDTCFNYPIIYEFAKKGAILPLSICDKDIENVCSVNNSNKTAIAGIACYAKYKDIFKNHDVAIVITSK